MALRPGFRRFAVSIQYHGSSFLGTPYLGEHRENVILADGTDLRGYYSVEARLRRALTALLSNSKSTTNQDEPCDKNYENIQISSRTDRGVHAIKNTLHVDIRDAVVTDRQLTPYKIRRGLNYFLARQSERQLTTAAAAASDDPQKQIKRRRRRPRNATLHRDDEDGEWFRHCPMNDLRILNVKPAPESMQNTVGAEFYGQSAIVDWNARFSAQRRTYVYRILHCLYTQHDWAAAFEWDRSWRLQDASALNVEAMQQAASYLMGTHDFTSFRAAQCQRQSPVVTMSHIAVHAEPYGPPGSSFAGNAGGGLFGFGSEEQTNIQLVSICYQGSSFLYRQVRNMTGCLLQVGRGKLQPDDVGAILQAKDRRRAPLMAPAHGLFLVNVEHEGIEL